VVHDGAGRAGSVIPQNIWRTAAFPATHQFLQVAGRRAYHPLPAYYRTAHKGHTRRLKKLARHPGQIQVHTVLHHWMVYGNAVSGTTTDVLVLAAFTVFGWVYDTRQVHSVSSACGSQFNMTMTRNHLATTHLPTTHLFSIMDGKLGILHSHQHTYNIHTPSFPLDGHTPPPPLRTPGHCFPTSLPRTLQLYTPCLPSIPTPLPFPHYYQTHLSHCTAIACPTPAHCLLPTGMHCCYNGFGFLLLPAA